jgi:chromosomal replication initiation ATPase DnaA
LFDKLFRDRQLAVDARVIQYLLPRVERNFHDIAKLVARIDALALSRQRAISVPLVSEAISSGAMTNDGSWGIVEPSI